MFGRVLFKYLSENQQIVNLREKGTILGTRFKKGRKAYMYLLKDFFVEVIFKNDNEELRPEKVITFANVQEFNDYLEREFKTSF